MLCMTVAVQLSAAVSLKLDKVASGLNHPVSIVSADDGSDRLFIVQQGGQIRILQSGALVSTPFLDLSSLTVASGERGLLGLAFHPDFATNGFFYVDYTDLRGDTMIARYHAEPGSNVADPSSARIVLQVGQPFANHNGGQLQFGPDGYLYVGMGDGGSAGDPENRAQDLTTLLGKLLRLDVDRGLPYTIPDDNPFVDEASARPEIWAYGLRNPWRFSFDRETHDLWIADVGQGSFEEVDFQPASSIGGENYGWHVMEAAHCFETSTCDRTGLVLPVIEYDHSAGCSVTGGYVYRGFRYAALRGIYFYGDYCSGVISGATQTTSGFTTQALLPAGFHISTFGEDDAGELYVADYDRGDIYHITDRDAVGRKRPVRRP